MNDVLYGVRAMMRDFMIASFLVPNITIIVTLILLFFIIRLLRFIPFFLASHHRSHVQIIVRYLFLR